MPVLLHIGPHDTGGPAIQAAIRQARQKLAALDVHYFGPARLDTARSATADHLVISSEGLSDADDETARSVVQDLGPERVRVMLTLRPLASILPVAWQRFVCNQLTAPYDEWLDSTLNHPETTPTPTFWHCHRHDELAERWASLVGPDGVTVVAAGPDDDLLAAVEEVAELPHGVLQPAAGAPRQLTAAEIELIRAINVESRERNWAPERYQRNIRNGVIPGLRRQDVSPDEPTMPTPPWAVTRANELAAAAAARISKSGVRVVGDLTALSAVAAATPPSAATVDKLDLEVASRAVIGAVDAAARRWKIDPDRASRP